MTRLDPTHLHYRCITASFRAIVAFGILYAIPICLRSARKRQQLLRSDGKLNDQAIQGLCLRLCASPQLNLHNARATRTRDVLSPSVQTLLYAGSGTLWVHDGRGALEIMKWDSVGIEAPHQRLQRNVLAAGAIWQTLAIYALERNRH
jgi:hypothetical protein